MTAPAEWTSSGNVLRPGVDEEHDGRQHEGREMRQSARAKCEWKRAFRRVELEMVRLMLVGLESAWCFSNSSAMSGF
jgi:hypothetical protein